MIVTLMGVAAATASPVYLSCDIVLEATGAERTIFVTVDEANGTVNEDGISYKAQFKAASVAYGLPETGGARAIDRTNLAYVRLGSQYGIIKLSPAHGQCTLVEPPPDRKF